MIYFDVKSYVEQFRDSKLQYDILKFVASLQGLANRDGGNLYLHFIEGTDRYWWEKFTAEDGFLYDTPVETAETVEELIIRFADYAEGVVLWDEQVPATANAAATICGVEGLLPVRYDPAAGSFYTRYVASSPVLQVKKSLVGLFTGEGSLPDSARQSSGSAKCDVYLWAKERYLDKGLCHPTLLAYYLDAYPWNTQDQGPMYPDLPNTMLSNHDYYIAHKSFFFDLSPWDDETPNDDRAQPLGADHETFKEILLSQYKASGGDKMITVGGFTPWYVKYCCSELAQNKHGAVETEWKHAELISSYNGMMDADAYGISGLANASIYRFFPLQERYVQHRPAALEAENKIYILFYMGDYDSAAWTARQIESIWDDPRRGEIPLAWGFNPNLSARIPQAFDTIYRTKSANDFIVSGDSGAGYLNPLYLLEPRPYSGLPDGMEAWIKHNRVFYNRFDISITGFLINGFKPINEEVQRAYASFSPDGVGTQEFHTGQYVVDGVAFHEFFHNIAFHNSLEEAAQIIYDSIAEPALRPQFQMYRCVLNTPAFIADLMAKIKRERPECDFEAIDPYNFYKLLKKGGSRSNDQDTIKPR